MKIKKSVLAVLALAAVFVTGCGSSKAVEVDASALANSLVSDISYTETLNQLADDDISNYIEVAEGVTGIVYMSSGNTAEEVAVFTAPDEKAAATMKDNVQSFLNDQKESFQDYIPEESKRVEDGILIQKGNYVVLCVSGDSSKAKELINKAFGE